MMPQAVTWKSQHIREREVVAIALVPDGSGLLTLSGFGHAVLKLWLPNRKRAEWELKVPAPVHLTASCLAVSPDGAYCAAGFKTLHLYELETKRVVASLQGHKDWVPEASFSPSGKLLATVSVDQTARLWNVPAGSAVRTLEQEYKVHGVTFSPDGRRIIIGCQIPREPTDAVGGLRSFDLTGAKVVQLRRPDGRDATWTTLTVSPNGKLLAAAMSRHAAFGIWDLRSKRVVHEIPASHHSWGVRAVFADGGKLLIAAHREGITLWKVSGWKQLGELKGETLVAVTADGKYLAYKKSNGIQIDALRDVISGATD